MSAQITIEYFGVIRDRIFEPRENISIPKGKTLRELMNDVFTRHGTELQSELLAPKGEPLPNVILTLNGHRIVNEDGMNQQIQDSSTLHVLVMPPFTGGG